MTDEVTGVRRVSRFAAIPNDAMRDESISIEARGLLALMMGMGESWVFRASHLMKSCGIGKDKYQRMIRELKDSGYLEVAQKRDEGGKLRGYEYIIHDSTGSRENRQPVKPATGKSSHLRTPITKNTNKEEVTPTPKNAVDILKQIVRAETAVDFATHRKALRKPLTVEAANRLVKRLANHPDPDAVFDMSIENGWQGVFPDKSTGAKSHERASKSQRRMDAFIRGARGPH